MKKRPILLILFLAALIPGARAAEIRPSSFTAAAREALQYVNPSHFPPELQAVPEISAGGQTEPRFGDVVMALSSQASEDLYGIRFSVADYEARLSSLAGRLAERIEDLSGDREILGAINSFFFNEQGFDYLDESQPVSGDGLLLNRVIDERRGHCLGLSVVYLSLAEILDLPVRGMLLPEHMFVRYEGKHESFHSELTRKGALRQPRREGGDEIVRARSLEKEEVLGVFLENLALRYVLHGRLEDGIRMLKTAQEWNPGSVSVYVNLGNAYGRKGEFPRALSAYEAALRLDDENPEIWWNMAVASMKTGDGEGQVKALRRFLSLCPRHREGRQLLAEALIETRRPEQALALLEELQDEDAGDPRVQAALSLLKITRREPKASQGLLRFLRGRR